MMRMSLVLLGGLLIAGPFSPAKTATAHSISQFPDSLRIEASDGLRPRFGGRLAWRWDRFRFDGANFSAAFAPVVEWAPGYAHTEDLPRRAADLAITQTQPLPRPIPEGRAAVAFGAGLLLTALVLRRKR